MAEPGTAEQPTEPIDLNSRRPKSAIDEALDKIDPEIAKNIRAMSGIEKSFGMLDPDPGQNYDAEVIHIKPKQTN